jgi:predicted DNA-binding transcriptional regulator AlpA
MPKTQPKTKPATAKAKAAGNSRQRRTAALLERTNALKDADLEVRLLSKPEVLAITGTSYPTLWQMMREGKFPRARIHGGRSMWRSDEIDKWLAGLPLRPLKGDMPVEAA